MTHGYLHADTPKNREEVMITMVKKHQVPQVPARGGGTTDRSRPKDGEWRKKRDDAGKPRPKSK